MTYDGAAALARHAQTLRQTAPRAAPGLPALFWLTDPDRTPDLLAGALALPPGSGVILRHFGRPDLRAAASPLAAIARPRGLVLLIAADPVLAAASGAHGVHWPNRMLACARRWRTRRLDWVVTASAHSVREIARAEGLADAVFLSPVFASASSSATRPLGPLRAGRIAQDAPMPVLALGGVNTRTVRRLQGLGFSGAGAVDALA
jgi:thiamine-phosphate pyrophosphorylase